MADICIGCGAPSVGARRRRGFCSTCSGVRLEENTWACNKVNRAVKAGKLPNAKSCTCEDCGGKASEYDHRDYTKPLDVVPVCRPCNHKRPPAYSSTYRPAHQIPSLPP